MMEPKRKAGRPKSQKSVESDKLDAMIQTRPYYINSPSSHQTAELHDWLKSLEATRLEILATKYDAAVSDSHAYDMASLEFFGLEKQKYLLVMDELVADHAASRQHLGTNALKRSVDERAKELCEINAVLLKKLKPYGFWSLNEIANRIHAEWASLKHAPLAGESLDLRKRGGDFRSTPPTTRTIRQWIKRIHQ